MSSTTIEPIATAIGSVEITPAVPADLDDVLDILNESARWLTSRGINQWRLDGFPRELIATGVELLKFAERATAATGRKLLRLDCFSGNAALCSYYERAGFVRRADVEVDGRSDPTVPEATGRFFARQYEKSLF